MYRKKTKIVCTIGPSSWKPETMKAMIEAGMNVARVNGAFADPSELDKVADLVRSISDEVALMIDVKGPEVRLNKFPEALNLESGMEVIIGASAADPIYPANYPDLYKHLEVGQKMVVGDGDVELELKEIKGDQMHCEVVYGDLLKPGKALNLPGADYSTEVLTAKDLANLQHAMETGWDFVSASFIQDRDSAIKVKDAIGKNRIKLIAKIEDQEGVDNIDEILPEVEGVMIARGGLGVELGLEKVHAVQKLLIRKCNEYGKQVITATQMLESMITNPRPTRAEVSDVASAITYGTDAVMLSGESTVGKHPEKAVQWLSNIALAVEPTIHPEIIETRADADIVTDSLTKAAAELCLNMENEIDKVLVVSRTGMTARLLGRHRIKQPIFAFMSDERYIRRMMMSKGINRAYKFNGEHYDRDGAATDLIDEAKELGVIEAGDKILLLGNNPAPIEYFPNIFEVIEIE